MVADNGSTDGSQLAAIGALPGGEVGEHWAPTSATAAPPTLGRRWSTTATCSYATLTSWSRRVQWRRCASSSTVGPR